MILQLTHNGSRWGLLACYNNIIYRRYTYVPSCYRLVYRCIYTVTACKTILIMTLYCLQAQRLLFTLPAGLALAVQSDNIYAITTRFTRKRDRFLLNFKLELNSNFSVFHATSFIMGGCGPRKLRLLKIHTYLLN